MMKTCDRPSSQATSVKAEPGSRIGSIASASVVNKVIFKFYQLNSLLYTKYTVTQTTLCSSTDLDSFSGLGIILVDLEPKKKTKKEMMYSFLNFFISAIDIFGFLYYLEFKLFYLQPCGDNNTFDFNTAYLYLYLLILIITLELVIFLTKTLEFSNPINLM